MRKNFLLTKFALLLLMLVGVGTTAWADDKTYSLTPDATSTGSSATSYITTLTEFTHNSISWKMNQWNPSTLQVKTNQSSPAAEFRFYNTSAFEGRIKKVVITFSALTIKSGGDNGFMFVGGTSEVTTTTGGTAGTWDSSKKVLTWEPSASENYTYFAFYQNGQVASGTNKLATSDAIVVTYESGSGLTAVATIGDLASTTLNSGVEGTFAPTITPAEGLTANDYTVAWTEVDNDQILLTEDGEYIAGEDGEVDVTITVTPTAGITSSYEAVSKTFSLTITTNPDVAPVGPSSSSGNFVKVASIADLAANDVFVIVGSKDSESYALPHNGGSSSSPTKVEVTIANDKITSTVADEIKWNVSGNDTDGYTFYPDGSTTTWLYCTDSNTGVRVGTNSNKTFSIESGFLYNTETTRYVGFYTSDWRCYKNINSNIEGETFAFYKYVAGNTDSFDVTIGESGYKTLVSSENFTTPTDVTAYIVTANNGSTATLTPVTNVPKNKPVILEGSGTVTLTVVDDADVDDVSANLLQVSTASTSNGVYVLANKSNGVGFYKWTGGKMGAGRVYLPATSLAREFISFDTEATGIESVAAKAERSNEVYDLQGRRVMQPTKGLYIVNGKKVIIK